MKTTCYLQIEPEFNYSAERVLRAYVKRVTQKYPREPMSGCLVVKMTLDIADGAFLPLKPEAIVTIPAEHTQAIEVTTEPLEIAV